MLKVKNKKCINRLSDKAFQANKTRNFIAVIEHQAEPIVKVSESLRVMKVIDLLFQSAEEGHSIRCNL